MSKDYRKSIVRNYGRLYARSNIKRLSEKDKKIFKNHLFARDEYFDKSHKRFNELYKSHNGNFDLASKDYSYQDSLVKSIYHGYVVDEIYFKVKYLL